MSEQYELQHLTTAYRNVKAENDRARDALAEAGVLLFPESEEVSDGIRQFVTERNRQYADALTLLAWASDCWQDGGELRPDFDDCVDAIRAFLGRSALATAGEDK